VYFLRIPDTLCDVNKALPPRLQLLIGAVAISFSPVLVMLTAQGGLGPTSIAFWRTLIGGVFLVLLALLSGKSLRLPASAIKFSALAGLFFFGDLFCWHRSIVYSGAGMATILGNTQVFTTALVSMFVFREKLSLRFVLSALAAFGGLVLLVGVGSEEVNFTPVYVKGIVFGLATGLAYSGYIVSLKKGTTTGRPDLIVFIAWTSLFSAAGLGLSAWIEGANFLPADHTSILALLGLGIGVQAVAWLAITGALPGVKTAQAGLILLLQPTLATAWGVLFFEEALTGVQVTGAMVTLVAMYVGGTSGPGRVPPAALD
jgi:drug/metabolite transporter (DMT)-like permease